jgi:DNA-binding CsgD family transcriptional regulator
MFGESRNTLGDMYEALGEASNAAELQHAVAKIGGDVGCPLLTYHWIARDNQGPLVTNFTTYPQSWVDHYLGEACFFSDPVVRHARSTAAPFAWSQMDMSTLTMAEARVLGAARDFGVTDGFSLAIRGLGDLALFSVCPGNASPRETGQIINVAAPTLALLGLLTHERARHLLVPETPSGSPALAPRETEVMTWVAAGKSAWDISVILGLSESTIREYTKNAFRKLGCRDRVQAAVRAVSLGLIPIPG